MAKALKGRAASVFGARLKVLRTDAGLTVRGLSARCFELAGVHVGQSYIGALERGERTNPSLVKLSAIAAALGTKLTYLLGGAGGGGDRERAA